MEHLPRLVKTLVCIDRYEPCAIHSERALRLVGQSVAVSRDCDLAIAFKVLGEIEVENRIPFIVRDALRLERHA